MQSVHYQQFNINHRLIANALNRFLIENLIRMMKIGHFLVYIHISRVNYFIDTMTSAGFIVQLIIIYDFEMERDGFECPNPN